MEFQQFYADLARPCVAACQTLRDLRSWGRSSSTKSGHNMEIWQSSAKWNSQKLGITCFFEKTEKELCGSKNGTMGDLKKSSGWYTQYSPL